MPFNVATGGRSLFPFYIVSDGCGVSIFFSVFLFAVTVRSWVDKMVILFVVLFFFFLPSCICTEGKTMKRWYNDRQRGLHCAWTGIVMGEFIGYSRVFTVHSFIPKIGECVVRCAVVCLSDFRFGSECFA